MSLVPHDFTKPTRLSVDWHNRLTSWWRVALSLANKAWTKQLPAPLETALLGFDLCYAKPTLSGTTDDTLVYRIKLGDRLVSLLTMPRTLMLNLVGLMLGDNSPASDRELTLIEDKLADYFLVNHWLNFFRDSWPASNGVAWILDGRETNLPFSRMYPDAEVLVALNWKMTGTWGETSGMWYFPKKPLVDLLGNQLTSPEVPEAQIAARREAIVHTLALTMEVVLGSAELRLSDLSSLQVGDVVLLDQRAADGVLARAGGQDLFRGQPGKLGSWKAFQIDGTVKK
jgi:flagellar motor switch protein FliM